MEQYKKQQQDQQVCSLHRSTGWELEEHSMAVNIIAGGSFHMSMFVYRLPLLCAYPFSNDPLHLIKPFEPLSHLRLASFCNSLRCRAYSAFAMAYHGISIKN